MSNNLFNNSDQTFKTEITEEDSDPVVIVDASIFTEAVYRIYAQDGLSTLVEKKLSIGTEIVVIVDVDVDGNNINVFKTTLLKTDMTMAAGQYPHQFKVTNSDSLELPPVFENEVTIVEVLD